MNNKKVLLLGTSYSALPILTFLKKIGFRVSVVGALKNDPGHLYADESFFIDYSDKEKILNLCREKVFDYIVPSCNDYSYNTASYVATILKKFSGYDDYCTTNLLHNKNELRSFLYKNGLPTPIKIGETDSINELKKMVRTFPLPVLIKPVDSFSGRGVFKITNLKHRILPSILKNSLKYSMSKKILVEECVDGNLFSHSAFLKDKEIYIDFFVEEYCNTYSYQVDCSCVTYKLCSHIKQSIRNTISKIAKLLNLSDGLIHTQFIVKGNKYWIIEIMRRCPGDLYGFLIEKTEGFNYYENYVRPFVNLDYKNVKKTKKEFVGRYTISSSSNLSFKSYNIIGSDIKKAEIFPLLNSGKILKKAPFDKAAILFLYFKKKEKMESSVPNFFKFVQINSYSIGDKSETK